MPLNTRSPKPTDQAEAATDEVLPQERKAETAAETATETVTTTVTTTEPEAVTTAEPETEPESVTTVEPEPEPQPEPEPVTAAEPEAVTTTEPEVDAPEVPETTETPETPGTPGTPGTSEAPEPPTEQPPAADGPADPPQGPRGPRGPRRRWHDWRDGHPLAAQVISIATTVLAGVLILVALVAPNRLAFFHFAQFVRIPVEGLVCSVVLVALPSRYRRITAWLMGAFLGILTILNLFDIGFNYFLGRSFNIILDWPLLSDAESYLKDSMGTAGAIATEIGAVVLALALLGIMSLAVVRLSNVMARHRQRSTRALMVLSMAWMTSISLSLTIGGVPIAAEHTVVVVKQRKDLWLDTLRDERTFGKTVNADTFGNTPPSQLVPALRGKDMIFTFIESYGRSAIDDPAIGPGVTKTLTKSTAALKKAGFAAKSGWLNSATYGGSSWLGHSTFMSGLWLDNQSRYHTATASKHLTLTEAFKKTGDYDTVGVMPGVQKGWPESKWYGLDKVYNAFQLGYKGPKFSWSTMPDQYALEQFQRTVHSKKPADGKSLMSFIILTSSHQPWAPIPKMVDWDKVGDGSIYDAIEKAGKDPADVFYNSTAVKQEYGKSVQYSVTALTQWLERYGNKNTVLVFLGDHQPMAKVSGQGANHEVPVSIVAKDPKVLDAIDSWNYTDGLQPAKNAPVWQMSAFRDKFLTAYGSTPHPTKG
ncbi:sulfatase [Actinobacteria bacterium OK074]|nr:sulfatase [Actinobacteria bacterium OK074]